MKIVGTSNFDSAQVSDTLIVDKVENETYAKLICKLLNEYYGGSNKYYFTVKPNDYVLYEYNPV